MFTGSKTSGRLVGLDASAAWIAWARRRAQAIHAALASSPTNRPDVFDPVNMVEDVGPWAAAYLQHGRARCRRHPLPHDLLSRLGPSELLGLIHKPHEEVRILGMVDLGKLIDMRMGIGVHLDPPARPATPAQFMRILVLALQQEQGARARVTLHRRTRRDCHQLGGHSSALYARS